MNDDVLHEAFAAKKEKFRVEIRRKNVQYELSQRRIKLSEIEYTTSSGTATTTNMTRMQSGNTTQHRQSIFSGEEKMLVSELQTVVGMLRNHIERLEFDEMLDVLVAMMKFLLEDQRELPLKIPKIIASGMLEPLEQLLSNQFDQMINIVNVVLQIVCNLTLGSPVQNIAIYDKVLKKHLLKFLDYNLSPNIIDSALYIIAHYFYDATPPRNDLIRNGVITKFLGIYRFRRFGDYTKHTKKYYVTYTWCLSAIGKENTLSKETVANLYSVARELFLMVQDEESAKNLLWWYQMITHDNSNRVAQFMIDDADGLVQTKMIEMLSLSENYVTTSLISFKVLSNLIDSADENQMLSLIDHNILDGLQSLLAMFSSQQKTVGMILWSLSNMVLLSTEIIARILAHPISNTILAIADKYSDYRGIEAVTCLCCMQVKSSIEQITQQKQRGVYQVVLNALNESNPENILIKTIDALSTVLDKVNQVSEAEMIKLLSYFDDLSLSKKLDELQDYPSQVVFERAIDFVQKFFSTNQGSDNNDGTWEQPTKQV